MPIPDFQRLMLPLLRDLSSGERSGQETLEALAAHFSLTPEELAIRIPSGRAARFANRIGWAKTHLKAAGLIESPGRAVYCLTPRGRKVLAGNPPSINLAFLDQFPEHLAFRARSRPTAVPATGAESASIEPPVADRTPDDLIEDGYQQLRTALAAELRALLDDLPVRIQEGEPCRSLGGHLQEQALLALRIHEGQCRRAVLAAAEPDAAMYIGARRAVRHGELGEAVLRVVHAEQLYDLVRLIAVEGEARAGIDDLPLGVAPAAKDEPADFGGLLSPVDGPCRAWHRPRPSIIGWDSSKFRRTVASTSWAPAFMLSS